MVSDAVADGFCILVIFLVTVLAVVVVATIPNFGFIDVLVWR